MGNRLGLHTLLLSIGGPNVYYQVPPNMIIKYPCIKYEMKKIGNEHANDAVYIQDTSYTITIMNKEVDDVVTDKISKLQKCSFDRRFVSDGIYHNVFNLYY